MSNDEGNDLPVESNQPRLPTEIQKFLAELPEEKREEFARLFAISISSSESYRGPVPQAEEAKAWQTIYPDAPRKFIEMAEKRLDFTRIAIEGPLKNDRLKIYASMGFMIVVGFVSCFALWLGAPHVAGIISPFGVVPPVLYALRFITKPRNRDND